MGAQRARHPPKTDRARRGQLLAFVDDALRRADERQRTSIQAVRADIDLMRHLPRAYRVPRGILRRQAERGLTERDDTIKGTCVLNKVRELLRQAVRG